MGGYAYCVLHYTLYYYRPNYCYLPSVDINSLLGLLFIIIIIIIIINYVTRCSSREGKMGNIGQTEQEGCTEDH